jgi:DNA polymerase
MTSETSGLDYETWSRTNLPVRGLANYVADPEFKILLASVATDEGEHTYDWVFKTIWEHGVAEARSILDVTPHFMGWLTDHDKAPIMAHNAPFERAVTHWLLPDFDPFRFEDSAVDARCLGAESKLIVASRQLTNSHKLEEGNDLVMLFCVPNEKYPDGPTPELIEKHGHMDLWKLFIKYCEMDAKGSREIRLTAKRILDLFDPLLLINEAYDEQSTWEQNQAGWHIDRPLILKMKQRAWANNIIAKRVFLTETGDEINFNSPAQLKRYCEERGFKVGSLDKYHLPIALEKVRKQIAEVISKNQKDDINVLPMRMDGDSWVWDDEALMTLTPETLRQVGRLREVQSLLETKQEIGGSTLSKLPKILDLVSDDDILRDQYMHVGAGQTFRTTGRGVQMQNLGKLKMMKDEEGNEYVKDISTVYDFQEPWSNGDMAGQLRQVFTARHPQGEIIVGDFSAVESRGLAYLAGEEWKLDAYREGKDVYKVLASKYFNVDYDDVTPAQRPRGKYSELSCGYQASAAAVQDFMFRLGFSVTIETALEDVSNWRAANPNIVAFWRTLDDLLKDSVRGNTPLQVQIGHGMIARSTPFQVESMAAQHPGSVSLCLQLLLPDGTPYVTRFVHGCYFRGDKLCYYKPAERLNGDLWVATYIHPKTKKETYYSIYGGKLAGIFTQSLCREMFFDSLGGLRRDMQTVRDAPIMGQFHDELNVDWQPTSNKTKEEVMDLVRKNMSYTVLKDFPLAVDVKSAYRYIK